MGQRIRNRRGEVIIELTEMSQTTEGRNNRGELVGHYWRDRDVTTDARGRQIGSGNLLMTLVDTGM